MLPKRVYMTIQGPTLVYKAYFPSTIENFSKKPFLINLGFIVGFLCMGLQYLLFMSELLQKDAFSKTTALFFIIRIVLLGFTAIFLSRFWYMKKGGVMGTMIGLALSILLFL